MIYGKEIILRGGRYFDYKRKDLVTPTNTPEGSAFLWRFKTLGIFDPSSAEADEKSGCVFIGWGNIRGLILSAPTEEAAVELLRIELTNDSEEYNGSRWDLELIGLDLRETVDQPIVMMDNTGA